MVVSSCPVRHILEAYKGENAGVIQNMAFLLSHGALASTGKLMILAVDQGFEHGPVRSFLMNQPAMDPLYHWRFAVEQGFSAFAAPKGMLEAGVWDFPGRVPLILKVNHSHSLGPSAQDKNLSNQAIVASVDDALRLGCTGIGFTLYPGSDYSLDLYAQASQMIAEAKAKGLVTVVWSYPRGHMPSEAERALDTIAYGVHTACLLGAHIVKTKLPTAYVFSSEARDLYEKQGVNVHSSVARIRHVCDSAFAGRRMVIFSGGEAKSTQDVLQDMQDIAQAGGHGSIMGRNCFQRPQEEARSLVAQCIHFLKQGEKKYDT